jgi:hypothetical protein
MQLKGILPVIKEERRAQSLPPRVKLILPTKQFPPLFFTPRARSESIIKREIKSSEANKSTRLLPRRLFRDSPKGVSVPVRETTLRLRAPPCRLPNIFF